MEEQQPTAIEAVDNLYREVLSGISRLYYRLDYQEHGLSATQIDAIFDMLNDFRSSISYKYGQTIGRYKPYEEKETTDEA